MPVSLQIVVRAIDDSIEGHQAFINRRTGELFGADVGIVDEGEDDLKDMPRWANQAARKLTAIQESADWLVLPDEFRCEDVATLKAFARECGDAAGRKTLTAAMKKNASVGHVKYLLQQLGLFEDWEDFRQTQIAERAAKWLKANQIAYAK